MAHVDPNDIDMDMIEDDNELIDMDEGNVVDVLELGEGDNNENMSETESESEDDIEEDVQEGNQVNPERDDSVVSFEQHGEAVLSVCNYQDIVVSGGCDDKALIWSLSTGELKHELAKHTDSVASIALSSDGKLCATGGLDGFVYVWDVATGKLTATCEGCTEVEWVQFHPRGPVILAASTDGNMWMWKADGTFMNVFTFHNDPVTCGGFTPCGKAIVSGSSDGNMLVWNPKTADPLVKLVEGCANWHTAPIMSMGIASNSILAATGDQSGCVKVTQLKHGKVVAHMDEQHNDSVEVVAFSAESVGLLASGSLEGKLCIWNTNDFKLRVTCEHPDGIIKGAWIDGTPYFVTACLDGILRKWDARTGACEAQFQGHKDTILDLMISKDANKIITASDDFSVKAFTIA